MEQNELTTVLESLVSDNETLKRDNAELQSMLTESREEMHKLQEELEELRARSFSIISRGKRSSPSRLTTAINGHYVFSRHSTDEASIPSQ